MEAPLQEKIDDRDAPPDKARGNGGEGHRNGRRDAARPNLEPLPDEQLVGLVLGGDGAAAFEVLMRRYNRRLFRVVRGILRNDAEAEDVVQEAYVRAYLRLGQLSEPAAFAGWLTRIAANEALEWLRQGRARGAQGRQAVEAASEDTVQDHAGQMLMAGLVRDIPTPEEAVAAGEIRQLLERAIDTLPDGFRAVFVLRAVEQLSTDETAACLGLRPMTVKTRFFRAKMLLRKALHRHAMIQAPTAFPFAGARCDRTVAAVLHRISCLPPPRGPGPEAAERDR